VLSGQSVSQLARLGPSVGRVIANLVIVTKNLICAIGSHSAFICLCVTYLLLGYCTQRISDLSVQVSDTLQTLDVVTARATELEEKARRQELRLVELEQDLHSQRSARQHSEESLRRTQEALAREREAGSVGQRQHAERADALAHKLRHVTKAKTALEVQVNDIHVEIEDVAARVHNLQQTVALQESQLSDARTREADLVRRLEETNATHATHMARWRAALRRQKKEVGRCRPVDFVCLVCLTSSSSLARRSLCADNE
jgi:rubrerythrin